MRQQLSISGSTLTLSDGGSVELPSTAPAPAAPKVKTLTTENLNDLTTTMVGICHASNNATAARHYPSSAASIVEVWTAGSTFVFQRVMTADTMKIFTRYRYQDTWHSWHETARQTDLAAAVKRVAALEESTKTTVLNKDGTGINGARKFTAGLPAAGKYAGDLAQVDNLNLRYWKGERYSLSLGNDISTFTGIVAGSFGELSHRTVTYVHKEGVWVTQ